MATLKPGVIGDLSGKIGQVVISKWRNLTIAKSTPKASTKPKTLAQLDQQSKFQLVGPFFGNIAGLIKIGYQEGSDKLTPINAAVKYHLSNAITGVYPNYALDFTKIVISQPTSKNTISGGMNTVAVALADAKIKISWIMEEGLADSSSLTTENDLAYFAFYDTNLHSFTIYQKKGLRKALTVTAQISRQFVGHKFQGYLFFVSPNGKFVSYSEYLGAFTLLA